MGLPDTFYLLLVLMVIGAFAIWLLVKFHQLMMWILGTTAQAIEQQKETGQPQPIILILFVPFLFAVVWFAIANLFSLWVTYEQAKAARDWWHDGKK